LPKEVEISSHLVHKAMSDLILQIIEAAKRTLEQVPPDLVPDLIRDGVKLAGGGALIRDLDRRLSQELGIPVHIAHEPLLAIARGGQKAIQDPELLQRIALT